MIRILSPLLGGLCGVAPLLAGSGCVPVSGDSVVASDLAPVLPVFGALPASTRLALAPAPGVKRIVRRAEWEAWARRRGLSASDAEGRSVVCLERRTQRLQPSQVQAAMGRSLEAARLMSWTIRIVGLAEQPVPAGDLEFPLAGLSPVRDSAVDGMHVVLWRGRIRGAGNRSIPVWARVELEARQKAWVALQALPAGILLSEEHVAERVVAVDARQLQTRALGVVDPRGQRLRRRVEEGETIPPQALAPVAAVRPGMFLTVRVVSGAATLRFEAVALSEGEIGGWVHVRNPVTGRRLRARLEDATHAVVAQPGPRATGRNS